MGRCRNKRANRAKEIVPTPPQKESAILNTEQLSSHDFTNQDRDDLLYLDLNLVLIYND